MRDTRTVALVTALWLASFVVDVVLLPRGNYPILYVGPVVIAAMRARGLPAFEAACAGAWLQGEAARIAGAQMIADDLAAAIPAVLRLCTS